MIEINDNNDDLIHKIVFFTIIVLALCTRLYHIDTESLFMDELHQVSYYKNNFYEIIYLAASIQQPPLDIWIGHIFYYYAQSDFAVRLPAALFGTGGVAILMLLITRISGWNFAIIGGGIMALLPFHIYFSQEARPYAIAIFFLLLLLLTFSLILDSIDLKKKHYIALLFVTCGFLYSRTLSPLITVTSLVGILFIQTTLLALKQGFMASQLQKKLIFLIIVLFSSILIYLPNLLLILEMGQRYAPNAAQLNIDVLYQGFMNFSLIPIWQAFFVQLEPLGYPFILLSFLSLLFVIIFPTWRNNPLLLTIILLLPLAAILHTFIFLAKTSHPFRPPYAVYIMPLVLIGSIHCLRECYDHIRSHQKKLVFSLLLIPIFSSLIYTNKVFYNTQRKTDWKGLTQYLTKHTDKNNFLLSDTFVNHPSYPTRAWEPNYYGFPYYYNGVAKGIELKQLASVEKELLKSNLKPVLIFFEWRSYFLTPFSPYPILPQNKNKQPDFKKLSTDSSIDVIRFTGFTILRLSKMASTINFATDAQLLLRKIRPILPEGSSSIDIHTAISFLEHQTLHK